MAHRVTVFNDEEIAMDLLSTAIVIILSSSVILLVVAVMKSFSDLQE